MIQGQIADINDRVRGVDPVVLVTSIVLALVPAAIVLVMWILAFWDWALLGAAVALAVFTGSMYRRETLRGRVGATVFWLSLEAIVAPIVYFLYWLRTPSNTPTPTLFEELVGIGLYLAAGFMCLVLGGVLYLVSRRLERG